MLPEGYYWWLGSFGVVLFYKGSFVRLFATEAEMLEYFEEENKD